MALGLLTPAGVVGGRPVLEELESRLHPWSSYLVIPVFALANAGATAIGVRTGLGPLPGGMGPAHVVGAGAVGGIGFTVSLFITGLAFTDEALQAQAKIGIFGGSLLAALLGAAILSRRR